MIVLFRKIMDIVQKKKHEDNYAGAFVAFHGLPVI